MVYLSIYLGIEQPGSEQYIAMLTPEDDSFRATENKINTAKHDELVRLLGSRTTQALNPFLADCGST